MPDIIWLGETGLVLGLAPYPGMDEAAALPESVEAQIETLLANLDMLLNGAALTRDAVGAMRLHLTQFPRFHKRATGALERAAADLGSVEVSWVGITALPGDALVAMDVWLRRA